MTKHLNLKRRCANTAGVLALLLTMGTISGAQSSNHGGGGRFEGTWEVRVTIRDCGTGAEITSFDSLGMAMTGGALIDSTSSIPPSLKTSGLGIWEHVFGNIYRFRIQWFNFDTVGAFTGWTTIRHQVELNHEADAYTSAGTAEIFAPNGSLVLLGCSSTEATRFAFN